MACSLIESSLLDDPELKSAVSVIDRVLPSPMPTLVCLRANDAERFG